MARPRIPTEVHAALHVAVGTFLIVMPWVFGFDDAPRARGTAVGAGGALLALGLLTRYELGLVPVPPVRLHLVADAVVGVFLLTFALGAGLAGAGWRVWVAFGLAGAAELATAALTSPEPSEPGYRRRLAAA